MINSDVSICLHYPNPIQFGTATRLRENSRKNRDGNFFSSLGLPFLVLPHSALGAVAVTTGRLAETRLGPSTRPVHVHLPTGRRRALPRRQWRRDEHEVPTARSAASPGVRADRRPLHALIQDDVRLHATLHESQPRCSGMYNPSATIQAPRSVS